MTTLYLVIDEGSGEGAAMTLANNEQHAIDEARGVLGYTEEERGDLRAVSKDTAEGQTRALLALWEGVAVEAMDRGHNVDTVEKELRELDALLVPALAERDHAIKRAVAEEREACALVVDQFMIELCGITGDIFSVQYYARDLAQRAVKLAADRIRARGEQRAPIAHAHRCACGKPATHEQCGGLLVCVEHIGPGRAWPLCSAKHTRSRARATAGQQAFARGPVDERG
jgi:hypothetical protein